MKSGKLAWAVLMASAVFSRSPLRAGTAQIVAAHEHTRSQSVTIRSGQPVRISDSDLATYWWADMDGSPSKPGTIMVCGTRTIPSRNAAEGFVYLSADYGSTWREVLVDASTQWVSEHSCAFGPNGNAYFLSSSSAFFHGLPHHDQGRSRLYRSSDDGLNWRETGDWPFIDFSSTAVNTADESGRGIVYIFANDINTSDPASGPGLLTFSPLDVGLVHSTILATDNEHGRLFSATPTASAVLRNGWVIGVFRTSRCPSTGPRPWTDTAAIRDVIELVRSIDAGLSLELPTAISAPRRLGQLSEPTLAVDRSSGPYQGRLYVSWAENSKLHVQVMLATSDDGGATWRHRPIEVLPDSARELGLGSSPGMTPPSIVVNKQGIVGVFWVEREGNCPYFAASGDGGDSFSPKKRIAPCAVLSKVESGWYRHYLFTWPASEANARGARRDETRLGLRIEMRVQSLTPTSMVADDQGNFHPMWLAMRQGGSQLWTTEVGMQGDSPTDPAPPAGLVDVSQSVALEFSKNDFNPRTNALSVEVIVVNRGPVTLAGPFLLRTTRIESTLGIVASTEKLDETANDCQFKPHSYVIRQRSLVPGGRSPPTRVSI
jgi:hypothetical protein